MQDTRPVRATAVGSFALGCFDVNPSRNCLTGPHGRHSLEPKLMDVLTQLAASPGTTLTKSELLERVWPTRYVVEGVLKRAISELRRVLQDDARAPRYIETVYKVGYRLIVAPRHTTVRIAGPEEIRRCRFCQRIYPARTPSAS